jgi:hypothetical protein
LPWPDFAAARAWSEAAPAVAALAHRRDGTLIRVRVEAPALEAYRALASDSPMPEGARVAAFHESPAGQLLGVYVLEKRTGAWVATELDAAGVRLPNDGSACLRCHDLAPTDHLFGVTSRAPGQAAAPAGELNDAPPR